MLIANSSLPNLDGKVWLRVEQSQPHAGETTPDSPVEPD
jgi:hypothetical protein